MALQWKWGFLMTYSSFLVDEVQSFIALGNREQGIGNRKYKNSPISVPHYPQKCCNL